MCTPCVWSPQTKRWQDYDFKHLRKVPMTSARIFINQEELHTPRSELSRLPWPSLSWDTWKHAQQDLPSFNSRLNHDAHMVLPKTERIWGFKKFCRDIQSLKPWEIQYLNDTYHIITDREKIKLTLCLSLCMIHVSLVLYRKKEKQHGATDETPTTVTHPEQI